MNEETNEPILSKKIMIFYAVHSFLTILTAAGVAWFSHSIILEKNWEKQYILFAGLLLLVIIVCFLVQKDKIYCNLQTTAIVYVCFLVSALLLLLTDYHVNFPVWLLGGIVAAALVDRNIGMLYLYYFVYHAIYLEGNAVHGLIFHFVIATMLSIVIPKMKSFLGMFYMMAFTACAIITGSVILNKMSIDDRFLLDTFYILSTYLSCIFITMLLVKWTGTREVQSSQEDIPTKNNYEYLDLLAQETAEQDAAIAEITKNSTAIEESAVTEVSETKETEEVIEEIDYTPYCNEKAELLMELRAKNKSAYAQSVLVGKLAAETAKTIGLNANLTKAAGLYKLIGKIKENSNEFSSAEVAKEHNFPEPLVYLLEQLNHHIIEQKEAAILLITDGVISYYSVVRNIQKSSISVEKIVDSIVSKKIFQGEFNESGLSVQECFLLREKLIKLLQNQDKKQAAK